PKSQFDPAQTSHGGPADHRATWPQLLCRPRQSRVVPMSRRWHQVARILRAMTATKTPVRTFCQIYQTQEREGNRNTVVQEMPGCLGKSVVTNSYAFFPDSARRAVLLRRCKVAGLEANSD